MRKLVSRSLVYAVAVGLIAAACGSAATPAPSASGSAAPTSAPSAAATPSAPPEKVNIRFSFVPTGQYSPFYLGREKGYYAAEGLEVELNGGQGSTQVIQTAAAGQDFLVVPGLDALVSARAQGAQVKAVATLQASTPAGLGVLSSSGITKPQDLAGKRIGISPGSADTLLLSPYLRAVGVNPDSVSLVSMAANAKINAVLAKQVDAVGLFGNANFLDLQAQDAGARFLAFGDQLQLYGIGLVTSEATLKAKPETVRKLVRATLKAHTYTIDHPEEAIDAMIKRVPEMSSNRGPLIKAAAATMELYKKTITSSCTGCMSDAVFQRMEDLLVQYGGITKRAQAMSDYYTNVLLK
jgi:NitT/TauT family transport system substrate-binding protein